MPVLRLHAVRCSAVRLLCLSSLASHIARHPTGSTNTCTHGCVIAQLTFIGAKYRQQEESLRRSHDIQQSYVGLSLSLVLFFVFLLLYLFFLTVFAF